MTLRIATFNLENFDDDANAGPNKPTLQQRITIMRPQFIRMRADVLCLQEVHSQEVGGARNFSALDTLIQGTDYQGFNRINTTTVAGDLYHERNLVILTHFGIFDQDIRRDSQGQRPSYQMATADPTDTTVNPVSWERPILYVILDIGGGQTLHVINLHLKSKIPSNIPGQKINNYTWETISACAEGSFISSMKRVGQALQVRMLIDEIFDQHGEDAWIAVCGDFNADNDEIPSRAICGRVEDTGNPDHGPRILAPCENNIPETSRYSLLHLGQGEMIDHVFVSRPVLAHFNHAEIFNEILPDESGAFRTDIKFPESDHAPVVAEFNVS